jgi:hypothetical protein
MNDKPERYYTTNLPQAASNVGAWADTYKDSGHRQFNKTKYDCIVSFPNSHGKMAIIEAKIADAPLKPHQLECAIDCAIQKVPYFIIRIFKHMFVIETIDRNGERRSRQDWSADTLEQIVLKIGEIIR